MPTGNATISASTCDAPMIASVTGTRCRISVSTSIAADEGVAPVALQHRGEPAKVALPHRIIEAELVAQHLAHFGRHRGIGRKLLERVTRRQREHGEQHDADAEHARHHDQHAPQDVGTHKTSSKADESRRALDCARARVSNTGVAVPVL